MGLSRIVFRSLYTLPFTIHLYVHLSHFASILLNSFSVFKPAVDDCLPRRGQHVQLHGSLQRDCRRPLDERRAAAAEPRDHCRVQSVPQEARHRGRTGTWADPSLDERRFRFVIPVTDSRFSIPKISDLLKHEAFAALSPFFPIFHYFHSLCDSLWRWKTGQDGRTRLQRTRVERGECRLGHSRPAEGPRYAPRHNIGRSE